MNRESLSEKQAAVYAFLVKTIENALPPTVREICRATGIKSTSTVHAILSSLEEKGYISRDRHNSRAIRIEGTEAVKQVPVLGRVTAGNPILAVEDIEGYVPMPAGHSDGLFALRVEGLSMLYAGILDGDIVVADKEAPWRLGDIIVALCEEDSATVKRIEKENGRYVLYPENPDYEPIHPEQLSVLGKVVSLVRKY